MYFSQRFLHFLCTSRDQNSNFAVAPCANCSAQRDNGCCSYVHICNRSVAIVVCSCSEGLCVYVINNKFLCSQWQSTRLSVFFVHVGQWEKLIYLDSVYQTRAGSLAINGIDFIYALSRLVCLFPTMCVCALNDKSHAWPEEFQGARVNLFTPNLSVIDRWRDNFFIGASHRPDSMKCACFIKIDTHLNRLILAKMDL
jgi:hypothetical protein